VRPALLYYGLFVALVCLVLVWFDAVYGDSAGWDVLRLFLGTVLIVEGAALALQRRSKGRREFHEYFLARLGRHPRWRFLLGPTLVVLGVVFAGVGGLALARGLRGLF
jgi:hypothetical protein